MILRKPNIRIATYKSLGDIAMSYSKTTGEVSNLVSKDCIGSGFPDQGFNCRDVARARCRLNFIRLCETCTRSSHIGKSVDAERIALADEERTTAVLRKDTRLRLDGTKLAQRF